MTIPNYAVKFIAYVSNAVKFIAYVPDKEWPHFLWRFTVGDESFDYKTGIGHAVPYRNKDFKKNKKPDNSLALDDKWVTIPKVDDVLDCLFRDAESGNESFNDFCDNLGYSRDSIKALDVYRSCMDLKDRLRKALGGNYDSERKRIEELNL